MRDDSIPKDFTRRMPMTDRYQYVHFWSYTKEPYINIPKGYKIHTVCSDRYGAPQWLILEKEDKND